MRQHETPHGFTLIELSVVLVIIALILGGILVGQDMVKAAEVRATIGQVEKFNAQVNTFRTKYNGLPGDITPAKSMMFGFFTMVGASAGTLGYQDGNGLLQGGATGAPYPIGEVIIFWRHLSDANLIDGTYGSLGTGAIPPASGQIVNSNMDQSLPGSKLSPTNYFTAYAFQGLNYYQLGPWNALSAGGGYGSNLTAGLTPIQAYAIDTKMDDGLPNTGSVVARNTNTGGGFVNLVATWAAASTAATCMMGGASNADPTDTYNLVATTGGNDGSCSLRFRFN